MGLPVREGWRRLGPPARVYRSAGYTVLVGNVNLLTRLHE
jgi:hypothetical protein